ncbi:MAG: CmcJ/NvfI family oxidoreductase [Novosphingobium sp.]|nr:CmcJ/NvfI family oxidoreductase [Novosphingobium sp.]
MASVTPLQLSQPDELVAGLMFVDPAGGAPMLHLAKPSEPDPERTQGRFAPVDVRLRNARKLKHDMSLDVEGVIVAQQDSAVTDFYDDAQIRAIYYPEIEALVKGLTNAHRVIVFDHTVRGTAAGPRGSVEVELPSEMMHCDLTRRAALEALEQLMPPEEQESLPPGRVLQLNLWRPISGPLATLPLAVCDASSIRAENCVETPLVRPDFTSEFITLTHDSDQRWFYLPAMEVEEVFIFKNYDSDPSMPPFACHGAFDDPTTPAGARPRESIEVRVIAEF